MWRWTNGGGTFPPTTDPAYNYSNFASSENLIAGGLQCVGIDSLIGKWLALDCGQSRQYIICQGIAPPPPLLPIPYPPMAPPPTPPPPFGPPPVPPPRPPFTPTASGETIVEVVATVVELGLTLSGDIDAFESSKEALAASLKTELSCLEPHCFLELRASTAGSVNVDVIMTIPDAAPGGSAAAAAAATTTSAIKAAANQLVAKSVSELTSRLGVSVAATAPVKIATGITTSMVVAPPPPSQPPPSAPPPPYTIPPPLLPPVNDTNDDSTFTKMAELVNEAGFMGGVLAGTFGGVLMICLTAMAMLIRRRRRARVASGDAYVLPSGALVSHWKSQRLMVSNSHQSSTPSSVSSAHMSSMDTDKARARNARKLSKAEALLAIWELDPVDILRGNAIGEGGQATVFEAKWNGLRVAIKVPRKRFNTGKASVNENAPTNEHLSEMMRREVRALARVRHPNVIRLYGSYLEPEPTLVMAYAPSGTLQDALEKNKFQSPVEVVRMLAGVARGMEAVHSHGLMHLDLKPENVLIGPLDVPWISDFGLSASITNASSMSFSSVVHHFVGRGTLRFKGPELFTHPPKPPSQATDVFAFAILSWIVVTGEAPYQNHFSAETSLPTAVMAGDRPELPNGNDWRDRTTRPIAALIERCWVRAPTERPTFGSRRRTQRQAKASTSDGPNAKILEAALEEEVLEEEGETGIVAMLEQLELMMAKSSDLDDSQLSMVMRLIAVDAAAQEAKEFIDAIDAALPDATEDEQFELGEERDSANMSRRIAEENAERAREQLAESENGQKMVEQVMQMIVELRTDFETVKRQVSSHDMSLTSLTIGELDCPRLFVLLPLEESRGSMVKKLVSTVKGYVKDRYRLVFLDPVTGMAVPSGPEGDGYRLELPIKWLVENKKKIDDGLKVVKLLTAAGRVSGLPLPHTRCLPSELVSKAEAQAVAALDIILDQAKSLEDAPLAAPLASAKSTGRGASSTTKAATGKAYKALRMLVEEQCNDKQLMHCELKKARAADGTIEFVSTESRERFMREGAKSLVSAGSAGKRSSIINRTVSDVCNARNHAFFPCLIRLTI